MRLFSIIAALSVLIASPSYAREKPPTFGFDSYRKTGTITGAAHMHNALLDLNKWSYWFQLAIVDGEARNPVLIVSADTPDWHFFDHAADVDGHELKVLPGDRTINGLGGGVHETIGVELSPAYVHQHRDTGMNIKIMGPGGDIVVPVPAEAVSTFADGAVAIFSKLAATTH